MFPEVGKPRITEIQVRIDCNGCVQKIKKALHGINGIYDVYIDFPQQKLTVVGWADPEKIVKAIKKTRKLVTICSHSEAPDPSVPPTDPPPAPPPDAAAAPPPPPDAVDAAAAAPPPTDQVPPAEPTPPAEPPKDPTPPPPPPENPSQDPTQPPPQPQAPDPNQPIPQPCGPKDVEEIHVIHHHPPGYTTGYSTIGTINPPPTYFVSNANGPHHGYWNGTNFYPNYNAHHQQQQQYKPVLEPSVHVTHSYNTYKPSSYVTEYQYVPSSSSRPPQYSRAERTSTDQDYLQYQYYRSNGDGNITSMFSDENPNACRIA